MTCKIIPKTQHLANRLEADVDVASRQSLEPYDDGRLWFYVGNPALSLGQVGQVIMEGDMAQLDAWVKSEQVSIHESLMCFEGENFRVLWFENAYVVAPYSIGGCDE